MPRLIASTLPDDMEVNPFEDLADDEIEVNHVKGELADDAPILEPKRAQNDPDDAGDGDELDADDDSNPAVVAAIKRERARSREREDVWLKETEAADTALLNSEKGKLAAQKDSLKTTLDTIDIRLGTSKEALKIARQEGDSNAATDIEAEMRKLENIRRDVEANQAKLPSEAQIDDAFKQHIEKRRAKVKAERDGEGSDDDAVKPTNSKAEKWAKANSAWFGKDDAAMGTLTKIDSAMAAEGYDPKSEAYYTELTKRMARSNAKLGVRDLAGRGGTQSRQAARTSERAPVAGARSAQPALGAKSPGDRIRVNLDGNDRAMMKKLGMDPANEKHASRFAKERGIRLSHEQRG